MADTDIFVEAPPERVFDVLSDTSSYGHWVVGSKHIRGEEGGWPAPGSRFHHTVGVGPLTVRDHTSVEESQRPRRLVLRAKFRPMGIARIALDLEPEGRGTRVRMREHPLGGPMARIWNRAADALVHARNVESLRRLKSLAERG